MSEKALKRFGQNFLTDNNVINSILELFPGDASNTVLEIGPGQGALTTGLIERFENYTGIDLDPRMIKELEARFPDQRFVNADILSYDPAAATKNSKLKVVGNIPYNISTPIFLYLCKNINSISSATLMVQKETAFRIMAKFGTKDYNASNVIINNFCKVEYHFDVSRHSFTPKPNVESAVISLKFGDSVFKTSYIDLYIEIVKSAFTSRRKVLKNSPLNKKYGFANFDSLNKYLPNRAEELSPDDYHFITNTILESR